MGAGSDDGGAGIGGGGGGGGCGGWGDGSGGMNSGCRLFLDLEEASALGAGVQFGQHGIQVVDVDGGWQHFTRTALR